jgi:hypothetical protein
MFGWYRRSARCYVYLSDIPTVRRTSSSAPLSEEDLRTCRWFTRGWTLQELIAPTQVDFFAWDGTHIGSKSTLETIISNLTRIDPIVLRGCPLAQRSIAERLSWMRLRTTRREEDQVYSLFGIFDVNMPIIYGEGKEKARRRLTDEILRNSKCATSSCGR